MGLFIAQIGNFDPPHSTENDLFKTLLAGGHDVWAIQEQEERVWERLVASLTSAEAPDCVIWTRTAALSDQIPADLRRRMQVQAFLSQIPTIGVHLDRWWGLERQSDLYNDPYFRNVWLFTADGHDPERWEALGANHHWMPPAIGGHNAHKGTHHPRFESEIAFVGGWDRYGHTDWTHRGQLVNFLRKEYRKRVRFWPEKGQPAIRGEDLNDLYASVKIVIGDSCLVPDPITAQPWTRYSSDRIPETLGRGGFLLHPWVGGVTDGNLYTALRHLDVWGLGDWVELHERIDYYLDDEMSRHRIARDGFLHVAENHTYANRLDDIFTTVGLTW